PAFISRPIPRDEAPTPARALLARAQNHQNIARVGAHMRRLAARDGRQVEPAAGIALVYDLDGSEGGSPGRVGMIDRWVLAAAVAGRVVAAPALLPAQKHPAQQAQAPPRPKTQDRVHPAPPGGDVEKSPPSQTQRAREPEPPHPQPAPRPPAKTTAASEPPMHTVACSGVFSRESSHLKLATVYTTQNVTFTDVESPDGARAMASVLFPKDAN